jgi:hypothetical protein
MRYQENRVMKHRKKMRNKHLPETIDEALEAGRDLNKIIKRDAVHKEHKNFNDYKKCPICTRKEIELVEAEARVRMATTEIASHIRIDNDDEIMARYNRQVGSTHSVGAYTAECYICHSLFWSEKKLIDHIIKKHPDRWYKDMTNREMSITEIPKPKKVIIPAKIERAFVGLPAEGSSKLVGLLSEVINEVTDEKV